MTRVTINVNTGALSDRAAVAAIEGCFGQADNVMFFGVGFGRVAAAAFDRLVPNLATQANVLCQLTGQDHIKVLVEGADGRSSGVLLGPAANSLGDFSLRDFVQVPR